MAGLIRVTIHNQVLDCPVDRRRLRAAVGASLRMGNIFNGQVNVAIVDDPTIHALNVRHLNHDYPTDVLSFLTDQSATGIEGDLMVSADTAARMAEQYGWTASDELLLYVVHGTLHLAGFDDLSPEKLTEMRAAERTVLSKFGLTPRYGSEMQNEE